MDLRIEGRPTSLGVVGKIVLKDYIIEVAQVSLDYWGESQEAYALVFMKGGSNNAQTASALLRNNRINITSVPCGLIPQEVSVILYDRNLWEESSLFVAQVAPKLKPTMKVLEDIVGVNGTSYNEVRNLRNLMLWGKISFYGV